MAKFVEVEDVDELEGITPSKTVVPASKPVAQVMAAAQPVAVVTHKAHTAVVEDVADESKASSIETEDVEFGDEELMKSTGLTKLLPEKGKTVRCAILGAPDGFPSPKKGFSHYIPGKGTFRCLSVRDKKGNVTEAALCCERLGEADMTIAALCLHYTNAPATGSNAGKYVATKGTPITIEWDIKWLKLSRSGYRAVSALPPEESTVYDIDFTIAWRNAQGGGFNYNFASKSRWKMIPALVEEVKEACTPFMDGKRLSQKLGKVASLLELKAAMSGAQADNVEEAELGSIETLQMLIFVDKQED